MKILIDMNLSSAWAHPLAEAGYSAIHWSELGDPAAPDSEILAYARDNGFVLLTNDLDFSAILATTRGEGPSVVQLRVGDLRPDTLAPAVLAAIAQGSKALEQGAVVTVGNSRMRIRPLPFRSREDD